MSEECAERSAARDEALPQQTLLLQPSLGNLARVFALQINLGVEFL